MIRLRMNSNLGYTDLEIKPTIFPDKTSQIWKLPEDIVNQIQIYSIYIDEIEVFWKFESETELIQVCQLAQLLYSINQNIKVILNVPYLPYGRQDKDIKNTECFAQSVFWVIITGFFNTIKTLDVHSERIIKRLRESTDFKNKIICESPDKYIKQTIYDCRPDLICFPDKGAYYRDYTTCELASFTLDKNRDPLTGKILGVRSPLPLNLKEKRILILDDICDGGWTFTEAAKVLYEMGAEEVYLYVTHGIFSKGTQVLKDAGIKRIFTYEGEIL